MDNETLELHADYTEKEKLKQKKKEKRILSAKKAAETRKKNKEKKQKEEDAAFWKKQDELGYKDLFGENKNKKNMNRKNTIRLTESELKRMITESVRRVLKENENRDMLDKICQTLLNLGLREGTYDDYVKNVTDSGYKRMMSGKDTYIWVISVGDRCFFSKHNFPRERLAEKNCEKYLQMINFYEIMEDYEEYPEDVDFSSLPKDENGYVDDSSVYNAPDMYAEVIALWLENGQVKSDVTLTNSGFWMD